VCSSDLVLRGSFIKAGDSFIITAGLQKPGTTESSTPLRLEASNEKDIIVKVDELARQVKEGLNLTAAQIENDFQKEAGKITTSSPEALKYYIEGRRLHNQGKFPESIAHMEKAVEIDPEFAMAYRSLAMSNYNSGNAAEARKYIKKALELSARLPENEKLFIEADVVYIDEDYKKEIELLERLARTYPSNLVAHDSLAVTYESVGNLDKAIEQSEFVAQYLKTSRLVQNRASYYMAKGLYQKAEDVCRSFLKDVEDDAGVHLCLSFNYLFQRQFDLAIAEQGKAYLLDPTLKGWLGFILLCKDDFAGAEKILGGDASPLMLIRGQFNKYISLSRKSLEESKGNTEKEKDACGELAGALDKAGHHEEASQAFDQYLRLSAECRKSAGESGLPYLPSQQKSDLYNRGIIQAEMKSFNEARKTAEELKSLIEKGINTKELRWYEYILGLIELGKKDYRQAADLFSRACGRLNFENFGGTDAFERAWFFDALARALYESGELDKARKVFEKITLLTLRRMFDEDIYAKAFYMLGKIAEQQGDKARAGQNYRKFLDLWKDADAGLPEVADARKRLAGLKGD
jgi:tetratricopeptide (TPR) repeat protein